jgi:4'-phosphopantetheinyl transferase
MAQALVYFTVFNDVHEPINMTCIQNLPAQISAEILQYKQQGDINRLTAGKYLLKKMLVDLNFQPELLNQYAINEMGKPYIPGFHPFNITHSGQVVACAVLLNEGNIGIDVEKIREIEVPNFTKQFSAPEMMQILSSKNPNTTFFEYWTMKEAVMKADGRGMRIPLHSIKIRRHMATIDDVDVEWNLYPLNLHPSVKSHISSNLKIEPIEPLHVEIPALLNS